MMQPAARREWRDLAGNARWLRVLSLLVASIPVALLSADPAFAHTTGRGFVMLLPTTYYFAGGGLAVAASFLILLATPSAGLGRVFAWRWRFRRPSLPVKAGLNWAGFFLFAILIGAGLLGSRDPLENPLPIVVWTLWWVGLTMITAIFGDLWRVVNPWTGPYRLLVRVGWVTRPSTAWQLPGWIGYWPAVAGLFAFAWFELVALAPDDPAKLAKLAASYWLGTLAAMAVFGEEQWRRRGEIFAVFFDFVARLAPLWSRLSSENRTQVVGVPGARLVASQALPFSGVFFILLALASVSFDGLTKTFWWLALLGINPLEFPGRSAVMAANTVGLIGAFAVLSAGFLGAVLAGSALAGGDGKTTECVGRLALSIMPIALGYHFAHYLTALLVNGQYALIAASDPFATGSDLLNIGSFHVTTSFLNTPAGVQTIWRAQAAAVVVAHVVAVLVAHAIALDIYPSARRAALSQIPLALLMIAYTVFGLWLLATPTGA